MILKGMQAKLLFLGLFSLDSPVSAVPISQQILQSNTALSQDILALALDDDLEDDGLNDLDDLTTPVA